MAQERNLPQSLRINCRRPSLGHFEAGVVHASLRSDMPLDWAAIVSDDLGLSVEEKRRISDLGSELVEKIVAEQKRMSEEFFTELKRKSGDHARRLLSIYEEAEQLEFDLSDLKQVPRLKKASRMGVLQESFLGLAVSEIFEPKCGSLLERRRGE